MTVRKIVEIRTCTRKPDNNNAAYVIEIYMNGIMNRVWK